jgi:hypothetical protein
MPDVVLQCDRLDRLIDGFHRAYAGDRPHRRHYETIFLVDGRMAMQIVRDMFLIPSDEDFLHAIQFANLRYPFDEVLLVDFRPGQGITYKAASRTGAYAERAYVWGEASAVFHVEEGEVLKAVDIPPLFERPSGVVPSRIVHWIDANLQYATLPSH